MTKPWSAPPIGRFYSAIVHVEDGRWLVEGEIFLVLKDLTIFLASKVACRKYESLGIVHRLLSNETHLTHQNFKRNPFVVCQICAFN